MKISSRSLVVILASFTYRRASNDQLDQLMAFIARRALSNVLKKLNQKLRVQSGRDRTTLVRNRFLDVTQQVDEGFWPESSIFVIDTQYF